MKSQIAILSGAAIMFGTLLGAGVVTFWGATTNTNSTSSVALVWILGTLGAATWLYGISTKNYHDR